MNISILLLVFAGISLYVAIGHAFLFSRDRSQHRHLWFALLCISLAFYDVFTAALYDSSSVDRGAIWQKCQIVSLAFSGIFLLQFAIAFTKRKNRAIELILMINWLLQALLHMFVRSPLLWPQRESIKQVQLFGRHLITYYELDPGTLTTVGTAVGLLGLIYICWMIWQYANAGAMRETRPLLIGMCILLTSVVSDSLVSIGLLPLPYVMEYAYLGLILCMAFSMTAEQITLQTALQEREEQNCTIMNNVPDIIYSLDSTLCFRSINEPGLRMLGYRQEEVIGRPFLSFVSVEDTQHVEKTFREAVAKRGQRARGYRLSLICKNGAPLWVSSNATILYDSKGAYIGESGVCHDITERRRSEETLSRLAAAVNQAEESIIITDATGIIVYVNPHFEKMTGYATLEIIGKHIRILKSGKHNRAFYEELWTTLHLGKTWRGVFTNRKKDGTLFQESAVISPVINADGKIVNYTAVKRDITQELTLEDQLRESQKMEAIGRLAGGVAHDFTNALVIMINSAQLAKRRIPKDDAETQELMDHILTACEKTTGLTSQLLAFSHSHQMSPKIMNMNKVVTGLESMLKSILGPSTVLTIATANYPIFAKIDPVQIEQILVHIVINARDAMPDGGHLTIVTERLHLSRFEASQIEGGVREEDRVSGDVAIVTISDTGCGMSKDIMDHIFEPFFTTKGRSKSTGLGLSTSYAIAKKHNGCIAVNSSTGKGTAFRICLPAADAAARPDGAGIRTLPRGKEQIVVVDDDMISRQVLVSILQHLGYRVFEIENSIQALDILSDKEKKFDLAIVDLVMPGMTGLQLADALTERGVKTPVLFISSYPKQHMILTGNLRKENMLLSKPFTLEAVATAIPEALKRPSAG